MNITVIAAGGWGTALAITFSARHQVTLWTREEDVTRDMLEHRENRRFLPGYPFPDSLRIATDFKTAVAGADLLIIAAPLVGFRPTLRALREAGSVKPLLWVCKGLEAETALLPHQVVAQELGDDVPCGVLSGPSFAEEVAKGLPLAITLASKDGDFARQMALELHSSRFRIYANDDLPGAEVGGAVKNVMAIATGICDGLGFGLNARAALMTRGLAEIEWGDLTESAPAVMTALAMPFTYSIADGIAFGFISYVALKAGTGKYKEISASLWVLCAIFIAKFVFL